MVNILFEKINDKVIVPKMPDAGDAGVDIYATHIHKTNSDVTFLGTGLRATCDDPDYYIEMYPRSSISKTDTWLANSVGIIDSGYRGEIIIAMRHKTNDRSKPFTFPYKCAQLIPKKRNITGVKLVSKLPDSESDRGDGGFGSTDATA